MKYFLTFAILLIVAVTGALMLNPSSKNASQATNPSDTNLLSLPSQALNPSNPSQAPNPSETPMPTIQNNEPLGPLSATTSATIKTTKGDIILTLYRKDAPNTVKNFLDKAKSGFYKNLTFHRVEDWVIQGGDPKGNGTGGGEMKTELNEKSFVVGSLGVARGNNINISNDSQFFITRQDATWLDKQYTNFGIVREGMDVVNKIQIGDKILGVFLD